jgi:hypothetical protein
MKACAWRGILKDETEGEKCSMSAVDQKRRFDAPPATSGLPQSTDIIRPARLGRFVPEGDIGSATSSRIKELHPLWAPSQLAREVE